MLFINRLLVVSLLSVGIAAATTAQAGVQLFEASWTVKAFGNECDGKGNPPHCTETTRGVLVQPGPAALPVRVDASRRHTQC